MDRDGRASRTGILRGLGEVMFQVARWMSASDKVKPVVNGARPTHVWIRKARADGPQ